MKRKKMATPANPTRLVQKSGTSLETFDDVKLFKRVPVIETVTSVQQALALLGNDEKRLFHVITAGLQSDSMEAARNDESNWLEFDENGKETSNVFSGTLVSSEILNPVVLNLAKINSVPVTRGDKQVEITWDEAQSPEEKRIIKDATFEMIKQTPKILEGLKRKMAASVAAQ